jgi:hypothetical protein
MPTPTAIATPSASGVTHRGSAPNETARLHRVVKPLAHSSALPSHGRRSVVNSPPAIRAPTQAIPTSTVASGTHDLPDSSGPNTTENTVIPMKDEMRPPSSRP